MGHLKWYILYSIAGNHFPVIKGSTAMAERNIRRPLGNFFIKRSVQLSIIARILVVVLLTSLVTTVVLALIYKLKSQGGMYYYMGGDIDPMELHGILGLILPALVTAQLASLAIALGIGLFSSRKVAVPLYKLEKWAAQLKNGKLNTHLAFRETEEMKDLTIQCNAVADTYKHLFQNIDESLRTIEASPDKPDVVSREAAKMRGALQPLDYGSAEEPPS
jgi:methyl-accepting chemotaxis protein